MYRLYYKQTPASSYTPLSPPFLSRCQSSPPDEDGHGGSGLGRAGDAKGEEATKRRGGGRASLDGCRLGVERRLRHANELHCAEFSRRELVPVSPRSLCLGPLSIVVVDQKVQPPPPSTARGSLGLLLMPELRGQNQRGRKLPISATPSK